MSKVFRSTSITGQIRKFLGRTPESCHGRTKDGYNALPSLRAFGSRQYTELGFDPMEKELCDLYVRKPGVALVVGCSAGRETIPLARAGHTVYGIDYIPDMINLAGVIARELELTISYEIADICSYIPPRELDYVFFSTYLLIPTREKRIQILKRLAASLSREGLIILIFQHPTRTDRIRNRAIMWLLNKLSPFYEKGDYFHFDQYFHYFEEVEFRDEAGAAGFDVIDVRFGKYSRAVLRKSAAAGAPIGST